MQCPADLVFDVETNRCGWAMETETPAEQRSAYGPGTSVPGPLPEARPPITEPFAPDEVETAAGYGMRLPRLFAAGPMAAHVRGPCPPSSRTTRTAGRVPDQAG
ncbi:carbohydrate-binding module family 14 protein [Streptomyces subrutilus]